MTRLHTKTAWCLAVPLALLPSLLAQKSTAAQVPEAGGHESSPPSVTRPHVSFDFERPGLAVPRFTLKIFDDGGASYAGEEVIGSGSGSASPPQAFHRTLGVSQTTAAKVFSLSRKLNRFNMDCASKMKNIADTGKKTLSYAALDGSGSCVYNYSENKSVGELTDIFLGIAETLDEGRRLDFLHRYDRLGLDAEMENFAQQVAAGRALEVGSIAESLRTIAADSEVMQRVRTRANALLALVPAGTQESSP